MTTVNGGTPRRDHVPTVLMECPVHGVTEFRLHRVGYTRSGEPKFRARCPLCHAARETARMAAKRATRQGSR